MPLIIKVTGATHHNDIFINASKIEFFTRIKPPKGDYTEISFGALDTSVCVAELPEEINNLIQEAANQGSSIWTKKLTEEHEAKRND